MISDEIALYFLKRAYEVAAKESPDPSTQVCALLVYLPEKDWFDHQGNKNFFNSHIERYIRTYGVNKFPENVIETPERWQKPLKYSYITHAETNAIYSAARSGIVTEELTMIANWFACESCAKAIIQAGIKEVIGHTSPLHEGHQAWSESIKIGDQMLKEAGVKFRRIPGKFGVKVRFNGEEVEV